MSPTSRTTSASTTSPNAASRRLCSISAIRSSAVTMASDWSSPPIAWSATARNSSSERALSRPRSSRIRTRVSGVRRSCAMSSPTPASLWISVSISSSMPLTMPASLSNGSSSPCVGRRCRRSPATMRRTRSLTSSTRRMARRLSSTPVPIARHSAGSRPSASACSTMRAISATSSMLRPIISTPPSGKARARCAGALRLAAVIVDAGHDDVMHAGAGVEPGRRAFDVARDSAAVGAEHGGDPDAARVSPQAFFHRRQPLLGLLRRDRVHVRENGDVDAARHIRGGLPIDEAEQQDDADGEGAGHDERPAERGRADEIRQAHGG